MTVKWMDDFRRTNLHPREEQPQNTVMSAMTREEMTAHLQAAEARIEARVVGVEASMRETQKSVEAIRTDISAERDERRRESKSLKAWMIGTGLTVVLGVAAFNATVLGNMVSSFDSGKAVAEEIAATTREQQKVADQLSRAGEQLDRSQQEFSKTLQNTKERSETAGKR